MSNSSIEYEASREDLLPQENVPVQEEQEIGADENTYGGVDPEQVS